MEIMQSCYKFMLVMGVCAPIEYNKWTIRSGIVRSCAVLTAMFLCVFQPCCRYFLQNLSNLVDATGVGLMISIGFFATVSLISFTLQQKRILFMLLDLQATIKKCWYFFPFRRASIDLVKCFYTIFFSRIAFRLHWRIEIYIRQSRTAER